MTNTTGPAELRRIADALDEQSAVFSSAGWIVITNTTDVRQQAAAWEADLSARDHAVDLAGINAEAANELERRAERAEAALEQLQDALSVRDHQYLAARAEIVAQRAALERARALLKRIEWQDATTRPIYCDIVVCVACGRDHPNHKPGCDLAALLAAGGEQP